MENKWFTIKQLTTNVWGIGEFKHFEEVACYLVIGDKKALLIDTGLGKYNIKKVVKEITKNKLLIINSHQHYDHIGGNKYFSKDLIINNQKMIKFSPFIFRIIKTPGHTPDSICFYDKNFGYFFSGDTLYNGPIYLHLKESKLKDYVCSIKKINNLKSIKKIFPGHNGFSFNKDNLKIILDKLKGTYGKKQIYVKDRLKILLK